MYDIHEIALVLPDMSKSDYVRLRDDIKQNGVLEEITLFEGKVLDGRHRQKACDELDIEPEYTEYDGDSPAAFVISRNLARRHLTVSQRAMVGAAMEPFFAQAAKKRQAHGKTAPGRTLRADRPEASQRARDDAAKVVGVSPRIVQRAKRVMQKDPEAAKEVRAGRMSVDKADRRLQSSSQGQGPKTRAQRAKELNLKKAQANSKLLEVQVLLNRLCRQLEDVDVVELIDLDGPAALSLVSDIHDDLLMLAEWTDRSISKVQGRLNDRAVLDKIKKLEKTNGRTPSEKVIARRLAKRLRMKLEARLVA